MATKQTLGTKTAKLREEMQEHGQVVLRTPALLTAAQCSIRFLLGAVLAGAEFFGGYAPFGVSMVACSGSGLEGFCALLGACMGYLFQRGLVEGLRYVAASILVYSVAFALFDLRLYRKSWFMPAAAAFFCAATGFVYLSDRGWLAADVIFFVSETFFAGAGAYFYRIAFSTWREERDEGGVTLRQTVSLLILGGTLLVTLSQITVLERLSLGRLLAALAVMVTAYQGGLGIGAAAGISAGLAMDLAGDGLPYYCMAFALSGLIAGAFSKQGKLFAALAYVTANAAAVLWTWETGLRLSLLYEVFIASVLFLLLPNLLLRRLRVLLVREHESDAAQRARLYLKARLEGTAQAFTQLHDALRDAFRAPPSNDSNIALVFDRAAGRVCRRCALRDSCWQRDYITTFNALNDATAAMLDRGRGLPCDFPPHFTSRCLHFSAFLAAVNEELAVLLCRKQFQARLRESRAAVCRQYAELGGILGRAAAELGAELLADPAREKKIAQHLAALGLDGEVAVYYDESGRLRLEVPDLSALRQEEERAAMSRLLGVPLRAAEVERGNLVFTQAEPLKASAGIAAHRREGETVSGDAGTCFRRADGKLYTLLCDGMGSGAQARKESDLAVRLLEQFLQAGVETEAALRTLSSALALRGAEEGGFTTVDLLELDLFTGEGALYKLGAAPSYLCKKGTVSRIAGSALPAGLSVTVEEGRADVSRLRLEAGDLVALVSDGITAGGDDVWLREALAAAGETPAKELACRLVEQSAASSSAADDRTAMVVRLEPRD